MGITTQIIGLIACLSFLVITHELGHFCFARIFHTRVDKFYMFFNPWFSIVKFKKINGKIKFKFFAKNQSMFEVLKDEDGNPILDAKGKEQQVRIDTDTLPEDDWRRYPETTEWGLGWLPLGGYCDINGMIDETTKPGELPAEPHPWEFRCKPAWQRLFIILGGVLVNFITALILYVVILFTWGEDYIPVREAEYGMHFSEVAQEAGFQNGDKILKIDGVAPENSGDISGSVLIDGAQRVLVKRNKNVKSEVNDSIKAECGGQQQTTESEEVTVYLDSKFAQRLIGSSKAEQYFCRFEIPFIIDSVMAGSPAAKTDLKKNDRLVAFNNQCLTSFYDFQKEFAKHKGEKVSITYRREGVGDSTIFVQLNEEGKLGVYPKSEVELFNHKHVDYGIVESVPKGISRGFATLGDYVKQFKLVFTKEGATQIGGFGTIGSIFPKTWNWQIFWNMTAFLAIILAFMNFLPIPALDGGYFLFILVEMITGRKPSDKFLGYANTVGFILLLLLLIYANGLDILRALM